MSTTTKSPSLKQLLRWANVTHYLVLVALRDGADLDTLVGTPIAMNTNLDEWDISTALGKLTNWDCRTGRTLTDLGLALLAELDKIHGGQR